MKSDQQNEPPVLGGRDGYLHLDRVDSMSIDYHQIGLKVGLEVHQQLATGVKLFCSCARPKEETLSFNFVRRLRPTQSELGEVDPAAMFEFRKGMEVKYWAGEGVSCLVEADEEPPHELNMEAIESALIIALALNSDVVDEIHTMRKIVIDGSNTTGFQRTLVVALGGALKVGGRVVGVQTISLEEDAARLLGGGEASRDYGLDRLGVPLVEASLAPVTGTPQEIQEIALSLGRLMRATKRVARGLGTIRQDLNISIAGGGIIEVKGVQNLNLLSKLIEYEVTRQLGLLKIRSKLLEGGLTSDNICDPPMDVSNIFKETSSSVIKETLRRSGKALALRLKGFNGIFSYEPYPDIRFGKELAELVRFYGLGGIFHSDELPSYGVTQLEVDDVKRQLNVSRDDGFVIVAGPEESVNEGAKAIAQYAKQVMEGIPSETRGPTPDGKTRFIRPRPGAARMYPETDIPCLSISEELLSRLSKQVPSPWEEQVEGYITHYKLSRKLAIQVFDSEYSALFEEIASTTKVPPSFVAATLTETVVSLSRAGLDTAKIDERILLELFKAVDRGALSKEAVPTILEIISKGDAQNVEEAIQKAGIAVLTDGELLIIVKKIVQENVSLIEEKGERAFSPLMGKVMLVVKGRADGHKVSSILKEEIEKLVRKTPS